MNSSSNSWNVSFQLQNAANSNENGQNNKSKKNPKTETHNSQTNSGPF